MDLVANIYVWTENMGSVTINGSQEVNLRHILTTVSLENQRLMEGRKEDRVQKLRAQKQFRVMSPALHLQLFGLRTGLRP